MFTIEYTHHLEEILVMITLTEQETSASITEEIISHSLTDLSTTLPIEDVSVVIGVV